jgi:hypothetical protein
VTDSEGSMEKKKRKQDYFYTIRAIYIFSTIIDIVIPLTDE